jgi:hypothetical protein
MDFKEYQACVNVIDQANRSVFDILIGLMSLHNGGNKAAAPTIHCALVKIRRGNGEDQDIFSVVSKHEIEKQLEWLETWFLNSMDKKSKLYAAFAQELHLLYSEGEVIPVNQEKAVKYDK